jgi:hypothetical protein
VRRFVVRALPLALFIAGFALLVVGVLYLITPVEAVPTFLGGSLRAGLHAGNYHTKRADVSLILGVGCLVASWWLYPRTVWRRSGPSERAPGRGAVEPVSETETAPRKATTSRALPLESDKPADV